jgi:Histidinol phosphatase and related hydrolases of the PHP family
LGLDWIAPEMRENAGEIEAAQNGKLPRLLEYGSLKGDLHCHSNWSDGKNSIEELAAAAMAMGYEYLGIADHTHALKVAGGLDEDQLRQRNAEIDALNQKIRSQGKMFAVLKGCEANIDDDGGIDLDKGILGELDFVIAGVHMNFKMDAKKMTRRLVGAAENPDIDIISHPTGRLLKERPAYELEIEKMFEAAKEHGAILEINAQPRRLDLKPLHVRGAMPTALNWRSIPTRTVGRIGVRAIRHCAGAARLGDGWRYRQHLAVAGIEKNLEKKPKKSKLKKDCSIINLAI